MCDLSKTMLNRLKGCLTLPSIPTVALEVLDLCQDEDIGLQEVSRVLERDPALSAKVLKVANSAWYGVRSQITSIDRALALLGINATLSLALSFSLVRSLSRGGQAKFDHQAYWRRSIIASVAARAIGTYAQAMTLDELFLAGLLQDIGMLALNESVPEVYGPMIAESRGDHCRLVELERERLGADHAAAGRWLLTRWNLPESLRIGVEGSHDPDAIAAGKHDSLVRSVALSSHIAEIWIHPQMNGAVARARESSISLLGLSSDQFDRILGAVAAALPEAMSNLDVDIGGEVAVNRILDQAREALVVLSLQAQKKAREFQQRSHIDQLTSLYNRAYLDEVLPQYFDSARNLGEPLSIIFLDLDHFKKVNDTYGHQAGDEVLISVAKILRSILRLPDIVGRYGGEEFLCLLPNTSETNVAIVGERLRSAVAFPRCEIGLETRIPVTISAGCATMSGAKNFSSPRELIHAADRCLYAAKSAGRNKVFTFDKLA